MQTVRILIVLLAGAAAVGQYLQERYRLTVIEKLPGPEARARYEATRRRGERSLTIFAIVCAVVGVVALVDLLIGKRLGW